MNLRRLMYPCGLLVLIGLVLFAKFTYFPKDRPFYVRLRKKRKSRSPYSLCNFRMHKSTILGDLTDGSAVLTLQLSFPDDDIINFQIDDPLHPRYTIQDVVIADSKNISVHDLKLEKHNDTIQVVYKNVLVVIQCKEFEVNIFNNEDLIASTNSQKFFMIERGEPNVGIALDFFFPGAVTAYGLPQHAERMALRPNKTPYRLFNADRFAYSAHNNCESLYGAVPLLFAHGMQRTTGLLWLNASETFVDAGYCKEGLNSMFYSESGTVNFYILSGPNLKDCVKQNLKLTGSAPLPPLFALGYHQSRFSYMTQDEVIQVSEKFDENELSLDAIWLDIDYTDNKKYFTWNPKTYANPEGLLQLLEEKKRKVVVIIDPHIKVDPKYPVYQHCEKEGFLVKTNNTTFTANCWPGKSSWIDFFNPKARKYYANLHESFAKAKNLHIWNDMNEPALFGTKENSMPKNLVHYGNWKHRDVHNLYGFYQTMATYEGLLTRFNVRPFILTRSHFAGSQRYAAIWTGDNTAEWSHLKISIPMCLTASLTGFSLCGADIGGFVHHPTEELLQRWYQLGAWLPFFRGHSNRNVPRREPYVYPEEVLGRIRESLQQRYRHLLYWYTLFWQHCTTLEPVIRPLVYQYPEDQHVLELDSQFLVGKNILICPITEPKQVQVDVYLPGGEREVWYSITKEKVSKYKGNGYIPMFVNMNTAPVFYRGGSIIPIIDHFMGSSAYVYDHPISLYVFCDKDGAATGTLYLDDGESFDYLRNVYCYLKFALENGQFSGTAINQNSSYDQSLILNSIYLFGYEFKVDEATLETNNFFQSKLKVVNLSNCVQIRDINIDIQENFVIDLANEH